MTSSITPKLMSPHSQTDENPVSRRRFLINGFIDTTSVVTFQHLTTNTAWSMTQDRLIHGKLQPWIDSSAQESADPMALRTQDASDLTAANTDKILSRLQHWSKVALGLVSKYQQNPLRAARVLSYLHMGLNDAWHSIATGKRSTSLGDLASVCAELAAHRAGYLLLEHFYRNETPGLFAAQCAAIEDQLVLLTSPQRQWVRETGTTVAHALIARSLRDGAGRVWPIKYRPAEFPGIWQASYPLYAVNPTEGLAGQWQPWVAPGPDRYEPPIAARPGSAAHQRETQEVLAVFKALTPEQAEAAQSWNLDAGSVTPAGVWMRITLDQLAHTPMGNTAEALQVMRAVSVAMHDAFIACWKIKFRDWSERPITAIRRTLNPNFAPLLVTPGFPSYVSGHATVSAAAAQVLGHFWPTQREKFWVQAQEAASSRLWGGIHFRSDNEEGLQLGRSVGADILTSLRSGAAQTTQSR